MVGVEEGNSVLAPLDFAQGFTPAFAEQNPLIA
jgi:hypothetical protein